MSGESHLWAKNVRLDHLVWAVVCAIVAAPILTFIGLVVALAYRWTWLGVLLIGIGQYVQEKLADFGLIAAPLTGGHMPDFGFPILFDVVMLFILILVGELGFPRLKHIISNSKNGKK